MIFNMKRGVKAVIFDIADVLALSKKPLSNYKGKPHHLGIHETIAKKLKITLDQYFDSIDTTYAKSIEGRISPRKVIKIISKNFKITPTKLKKLYSEAYKSNFKQNKKLLNQAFKLKKQGHKIAVLSDQWHLSRDALIPKKIYKNFDFLVVSCDVGIRKPGSKIFKLALKKLKLKPSETLFIDNQKWNIDQAKKLGMKTILFKDNKQLFKDSKWKRLFL